MRFFFTLLLGALVATLAIPQFASAHARLDRSEPAVDAVISASPTEVRIWFTQELTLSRNELGVYDELGTQVDSTDARVDQSDPNRKQLVVSVPPLGAGWYEVRFTSSSAEDGDLFSDSYWFQIASSAVQIDCDAAVARADLDSVDG